MVERRVAFKLDVLLVSGRLHLLRQRQVVDKEASSFIVVLGVHLDVLLEVIHQFGVLELLVVVEHDVSRVLVIVQTRHVDLQWLAFMVLAHLDAYLVLDAVAFDHEGIQLVGQFRRLSAHGPLPDVALTFYRILDSCAQISQTAEPC